jgi:hypothetical protein
MRGRARGARLAGVLGLLLGLLPGTGPAADLAGTQWERIGRAHGLDPRLLYAVALLESGRSGAAGVTPWPWVVNTPGGPRYFESESEARAALATLLTTHRPVDLDVGLMQVNLYWHGARVSSPAVLLDPVTNLELAAGVLASALRSAPADPALGAGRYHSWDPARARPFGERALALARALARGESP